MSGTWKFIAAISQPCGFSSLFCTQCSFSSPMPHQECCFTSVALCFSLQGLPFCSFGSAQHSLAFKTNAFS